MSSDVDAHAADAPDVTDAPDAQSSVRLATLGEIALDVAHELRNLLLVIDGSTYLAQKDPAASAGHLAKIERSVRAARAVVDDIFMLARDETLPFEDADLAEVLVLARSELREDAADWVDALGTVTLRAHDRLLARLFKVLYENATQACDPNVRPRIETRATEAEGVVTLDVEDDGPGVPEAVRPRIFAPLVTSRPGGTGMGLPLARRIAEAHGGKLELVQGHGAGACFRITLPKR